MGNEMSASARDCLENTSSPANCFARRDAGVRSQMVSKKSVDVAACLASCDDEHMRCGLARLVSPSGHVSEAWIPEGLQIVPAEGLGDAQKMAFSPSTISPSRLDTLPSNARCLATPPPTVAGGGPGPMRVSSKGSMRQCDDIFSSFLHERKNCSSQYVASDSTPQKSCRSGSCVSKNFASDSTPQKSCRSGSCVSEVRSHENEHKETCRISLYQTAPEMGSAQNHFKDSRHDHTSFDNRVGMVARGPHRSEKAKGSGRIPHDRRTSLSDITNSRDPWAKQSGALPAMPPCKHNLTSRGAGPCLCLSGCLCDAIWCELLIGYHYTI